MLKKSLFQGHYRFAQAYFELGFPEKAIAVNSFAQKCCSSTLNLLCQAVAFKKGMYLVSQLFYFNGTEQWLDIAFCNVTNIILILKHQTIKR